MGGLKMTEQQLREIEARCEAATPGPWESRVNGNTVRSYGVVSNARKICSSISTLTADAEFIAHSRQYIPALLAEVRQLQRERDAAVEVLIKLIKQSDDMCAYCKNHIECKGEQCEKFEKGVGGTGNDGTAFPDWHWQCTLFNYGTCGMMENTPCNGCFENDYKGFEWRRSCGPRYSGL